MKKAYGYMRVSGKNQIEGDGFKRQENAIREYAQNNGIEIESIFHDDGISGTLEDRPALAEMMLSLEKNGHGIKTVIIERIDRLARDLMIQETILEDLKQQGIEVVSACDGDLLEDDSTRKLVRQVLGAMAEYDKTMTVLKLKAARERRRAETGKCEGRKSYSEANPEIIREIRRLRRKSKNRKPVTFSEIAVCLNEKGHRTLTGGFFTTANVQMLLNRSVQVKLPAIGLQRKPDSVTSSNQV